MSSRSVSQRLSGLSTTPGVGRPCDVPALRAIRYVMPSDVTFISHVGKQAPRHARKSARCVGIGRRELRTVPAQPALGDEIGEQPHAFQRPRIVAARRWHDARNPDGIADGEIVQWSPAVHREERVVPGDLDLAAEARGHPPAGLDAAVDPVTDRRRSPPHRDRRSRARRACDGGRTPRSSRARRSPDPRRACATRHTFPSTAAPPG